MFSFTITWLSKNCNQIYCVSVLIFTKPESLFFLHDQTNIYVFATSPPLDPDREPHFFLICEEEERFLCRLCGLGLLDLFLLYTFNLSFDLFFCDLRFSCELERERDLTLFYVEFIHTICEQKFSRMKVQRLVDVRWSFFRPICSLLLARQCDFRIRWMRNPPLHRFSQFFRTWRRDSFYF